MSSLFYDVLVIASVMRANVQWFAEPGGVAEDETPAAAQVRLLGRLSKHSSCSATASVSYPAFIEEPPQ